MGQCPGSLARHCGRSKGSRADAEQLQAIHILLKYKKRDAANSLGVSGEH